MPKPTVSIHLFIYVFGTKISGLSQFLSGGQLKELKKMLEKFDNAPPGYPVESRTLVDYQGAVLLYEFFINPRHYPPFRRIDDNHYLPTILHSIPFYSHNEEIDPAYEHLIEEIIAKKSLMKLLPYRNSKSKEIRQNINCLLIWLYDRIDGDQQRQMINTLSDHQPC